MISIIIPTKNDLDLRNTLEAVTKAKKPEKTEIIVVDGSKRETLLEIKKKFSTIRWIYYKNNTGKKRTFVEQLNLGTKMAKGDILVFVDGGCTVDKFWLQELIKPLRKDNEDFVVGLVIPKGKSHHNLIKNSLYVESCGTANTAIKKKVALDIGKRDTFFNYGSDIDFSWRARDLGYKIKYAPKAIMYHDWGNIKSDIKRAINYGEARLNLHLKHKNRRWRPKNCGLDLFTFYSLVFFFYILSLIPVTIFWNWYPIFLLIPFIKNIKVNPLRKIVFDFFWGYGVIKRLIEVTFNVKK